MRASTASPGNGKRGVHARELRPLRVLKTIDRAGRRRRMSQSHEPESSRSMLC